MTLADAWERFATVTRLEFVATSATGTTGWTGTGTGNVAVEFPDTATCLFHEAGRWVQTGGRGFAFSNVFRWTRGDGFLRLNHLRFGPSAPVQLFDLIPAAGCLESANAHVCRDDCYAARLDADGTGLRLTWTVTGPRKNETIAYRYR